jgi:hypothetical protein
MFSPRIHLEYFKTQIILFTLILKVITSTGNETIFHLIVKSDNEIEEEEIDAALKRVLILLDQVNDLSKSAK